MTQRLVLASNNSGKLKEFSQILAPLGFELHPQGEFNVPECEEPFATFVENALEKARHASRLTGLPALADDSGVCVNALGGAPGVWSARYAGEPKSDARNNQKVIADLAAHADKTAYYYCVLVYVRHADDPQPVIADGIWPAKSARTRAAPTASATTRISGCRRSASRPPNCRQARRTRCRTAARRCVHWSGS